MVVCFEKLFTVLCDHHLKAIWNMSLEQRCMPPRVSFEVVVVVEGKLYFDAQFSRGRLHGGPVCRDIKAVSKPFLRQR